MGIGCLPLSIEINVNLNVYHFNRFSFNRFYQKIINLRIVDKLHRHTQTHTNLHLFHCDYAYNIHFMVDIEYLNPPQTTN